MKAFQILSLSPSLSLTEEEIKAAYDRSAQGEEELSARNSLLSPASMLQQWMQEKALPLKKHSSLPEAILPLFSQMAETINGVNDLSQRQAKSQTLLAQTLLSKQLLEHKTQLDHLNTQIAHIEAETLSSLPELEENPNAESANLTLQALKFLQKWKADLNLAYGKLF